MPRLLTTASGKKRMFYVCRRMSVRGEKRSAADITAKTDFDPERPAEASPDLPIAALFTDLAMEAWYHPSIA
jgi:hypothetical protein